MRLIKNLQAGLLVILLLLGGCSSPQAVQDMPKNNSFVIVSGSENKAFEPIIQKFAKANNVSIQMQYKGSLDIMQDLQGTPNFDAVWPANSIWINMGDPKHKVKDVKSIMSSPVVFGIRKSKAAELGFVGKQVSIKDILKATQEDKLHFIMTSASQSNSGASAYLGFLYGFLNNPEAITLADLSKPELKPEIKQLLSGVNRSSGSSDWLKDVFLLGNYEAMVNYESLIIETNQELVSKGKEPLYLVYPYDALTIADSPLGYIDRGNSQQEDIFKKLQAYLLTVDVQKQILQLGRRTGFGGTLDNADPKVFNPDWGIDVKKTLSPIRYPQPDVIQEALRLYQSEFKKPSFTVFAIDYSGSMSSNGGAAGVKSAMDILLTKDKAQQYMLQASADDKIVVIPFNNQVINVWKADGGNLQNMANLLSNVKSLEPGGGTDIYTPAIEGLKILNGENLSNYIPSVVLMTDGQSNTGKTFNDLRQFLQSKDQDIPVFAITFGSADDSQLGQITDITRGKVFDGKKDLVTAFKQVRGYN